MSSEPTCAATGQLPKHRACDECRFRKIACSKEPGGCARCEKEGIQCHYSPQKPMGRPRKRRRDDCEEPQLSLGLTAGSLASAEFAAAPVIVDSAAEYPAFFTDDNPLHGVVLPPDESGKPPFGIQEWKGDFGAVSFIDLLPDFYPDSPDIFSRRETPLACLSSDGQQSLGDDPSSLYSSPIYGSEHLEPTDCHDHSHAVPVSAATAITTTTAAVTAPASTCSSGHDKGAATLYSHVPHTHTPHSHAPHTHTAHSHTHSHAPHTPAHVKSSAHCQGRCQRMPETPTTISTPPSSKPAPGLPCTCLSSLYFALNSLTQLPSDIPSAIGVARHASKTAHQVLNCPECYDITIEDPARPPPIQCFQNRMCLGTLVPSACNAYATILKMVDSEAERANRENRKMWFSFDELGGSWSSHVGQGGLGNDFLLAFNDRWIAPDLWRGAIRQVLRIDVHGRDGACGPSTPSCRTDTCEAQAHPLKGVINLLDEKNRRRHAQIDRLIIMGRMPQDSPYLLYPARHKVMPSEPRTCVQDLEVARLALSNLVIQ